MSEDLILTEKKQAVGVIRLHRPDALNALNQALISAVAAQVQAYEADDGIGAILLLGGEKAFAAGADIKEMQQKDFADALSEDFIRHGWQEIAACRKPIIAAVRGYALGGGCELAMMCDILYASDTAKFGQPEIKLGVLPGAGGTQRLVKALGKAKAMELVLTGRFLSAEEAEAGGLVAKILPDQDVESYAETVAQEIASYSKPVVGMAKKAVLQSYEMGLSASLQVERDLFYSAFALEDRREGMTAFVEKRTPKFKDR